MAGRLPVNVSARYRHLRQTLFWDVVHRNDLTGVLLAHHADDQAETILQRLLRGSEWIGLCGMASTARLRTVTVCRPLLQISSVSLRIFLQTLNQSWREDSSNDSDCYQRNRLRRFLRGRRELTPLLLAIGDSAREFRDWIDRHSPALGESFDARQLADHPAILTRRSAARWLRDRGVPPGEITSKVTERLLAMVTDAATPNRVTFPGSISVQRRRGTIIASSLPAALANSAIASPALPPAALPP